MAADKTLLIGLLSGLAAEGHPRQHPSEVADRVRAALLLVSSHSITTCAAVERIGYEPLLDERTGVPFEVRGLSLPETGCHLSDVLEGLMGAERVPPEVEAWLGEVSLADYRAGLFAIRCILTALQWSEHDEKKPRVYAAEQAEVALERSLAVLRGYRETGEP